MKYPGQLLFSASLFAGAVFGQNSTGVMGGMTAVIRTGDFAGPRAIANQPYSAKQITEHIQTLADGTHITQPSQETMLYRDSLGRTRTERSFPTPPGVVMKTPPPVMIEISDPVAGVRYTLDSHSHIARRMNIPQMQPMPVAKGATGTATWTQSSSTLPAPVTAARVVQSDQPRPEFKNESLGTDMKEGLSVTGQRTTTVYPVGFLGNDRPITVVNETWTSAELGMTVLSKMSDPRSGESTTRLTNVSRAEPAAGLFQVPADYTIEDPTGPGK